MHWKISNKAEKDLPIEYLPAHVNADLKLTHDLKKSDFTSDSALAQELRRISVPNIVGICSEQDKPEEVKNISKIARGRRSKLETLLDFGAYAPLKEVAFVPVGQKCPAETTNGRMVHPHEIGTSSIMDLALYTHGSSQRRFE